MTTTPTSLVVEASFKFEKETKGTLRYQEIDEKGQVIDQVWAKIGTLYLRKNAFARGAKFPQNLRVTLECTGGAGGGVMRIKPTFDQIVDQRLHDGGVLSRPFDQAERMLVAFCINAEGGNQPLGRCRYAAVLRSAW
jgi:hypothetical protein